MSRVKNCVQAKARHKKILKLAKGYRERNSKVFRVAIERVEKALSYAYRDRRNRKRDFRSLWIQRINAKAREFGMTYSSFTFALKQKNIEMDRKILADIAVKDSALFASIVDQIRPQ